MTDSMIRSLRYPKDRFRIGFLSISDFQVWYSALNPQWLINNADSKEFKRFVRFAYGWKLSILRFWFRIKRIMTKNSNLHGSSI